MKKTLFALILLAGIFMTSCQVKTAHLGDADRFADGVSYFQDNTGSVFAVIVIRKQGTMQQEGIGLAYIPKAEITPAIKAQIKHYKE